MKRSSSDSNFQDAAKKLLARFGQDCIPEDQLSFVKHLGAGEYGTVDKYEYVDEKNVKSALALKLFKRDLLSSEVEVKNFVNEIRTLKKLSHPNIAAYVGTGTIKVIQGSEKVPKDHIFMAQECCDGLTLQDVLAEQMSMRPGQQAYKWSDVVSWMMSVCSGLKYMHCSNPMVMHRDLKPANIILVADGTGNKIPKLVDFGLHKVIHLHSEESIRGGVFKYATGSRRNWGNSKAGSNENSQHGPGSRMGTSLDTSRAGMNLITISGLAEGNNQVVGKEGSIHVRNGFSGMHNQGFEMTGGCGSLVYMAPEVHKGEQYNHMVDVFSIALIFWELFAYRTQMTITEAQLGNLTYQAVNKYTTDICCGLRPPLPKIWPKVLRSLFADMWQQDYTLRPSFSDVLQRLQEVKVVVDDLETRGKCPMFQGVLPGMQLAVPKPKSGDKKSVMKKLKSLFTT